MEAEAPDLVRRVQRGYKSVAILLLNFVSLVIILNVLLGAAYWAKDAISAAPAEAAAGGWFRDDGAPVWTAKRTGYQMRWFDAHAYGSIDPQYAVEVLDDFHDLQALGFVYQPWVQFAEPPFRGRRVHVDLDERGFPIRRTIDDRRLEKDPVVRIFVFGGSTTFAYNVSDEHTWPSFLSRILSERAQAENQAFRIEVVNYGHGYYYPSQETILLADLLKSGHRPSLAIFMDGVNWGAIRDVPQFNAAIAQAFIAAQQGRDVTAADVLAEFRWVPMVRFAGSVRRRLDRWFGPPERAENTLSPEEWEERVAVAVNQFEQSRRMAHAICGLYGCRTLFFLQPNALHGYNLQLYRRALPEPFTSRVAPTASLYERIRRVGGYIDLSHLFRVWGKDRKAIVDDVHYSPDFNRFLAEHVAAHIDLGDLPVFPNVIDDRAATGGARSVTIQGFAKARQE